MDNNFNVDTRAEIGYNSVKNDDNVIVVKLDEQVPVNDVDCRHETLVADPNDVIGNAVYHGCINTKCGVGFYLK